MPPMSDLVIAGLSAPLRESAITTVALSDALGASSLSPFSDAMGPCVVRAKPALVAPAELPGSGGTTSVSIKVVGSLNNALFGLLVGVLIGLDTSVTITPTTPGLPTMTDGGGAAPVTV